MDLLTYLALFVGASVFLAIEPGPGFVTLVGETARRGPLAAAFAALGMALGALPAVILVAVGLDALIAALPGALSLLKAAGAVYLVWQAAQLLRRPADTQRPAPADTAEGAGRPTRNSLRAGALLVLLNPRTPALYAAFLPLFLRSDSGIPAHAQLLALGLGVIAVFLAVDLVFVAVASRIGARLADNATVGRVMRYLGASLLVLFGVRLLTSRD